MSIGTKITAVMEACRYMPKDGYNNFHKYAYTTAAGLFAKVNEALTEQKLYASTRFELLDSREVQTGKGNVEKYAVVKVTITIKDADDPQESVTFEGLGSGQDATDKAVMKGNTAALKYAYIGGLNIAMSDDPEQDSSGEAYQNYTPKTNSTATKSAAPKSDIAGKCDKCGKAISSKVAEYSQKKFGKKLCYNCQNGGESNPF